MRHMNSSIYIAYQVQCNSKGILRPADFDLKNLYPKVDNR